MTIFDKARGFTDEQVREKLFTNFRFLTGEDRPMVKGGKTKNDADITPEQWFQQMSPIHMLIFCQAFHEATARGLMNAFEQKACQEVFDML